MTDEKNDTSLQAPAARAHAGRSPAGGLALLLSLVALIGLGYVWYQLAYKTRIVGINIASHLAAQKATDARFEQQLATLTAAHEQAVQEIAALKSREEALAALKTGGRASAHWRIRAAQDLLLMANEQLHFEHNVPLALLALHQAQREIRRDGDPRLLPVRMAILHEILQLHALRTVHVSTMALELITMSRASRTLPLALPTTFHKSPEETQAATRPLKAWKRLGEGIWHDFVSLIRIHKEPLHERALLAPKRAYFVRENLAIRLYGAQLALLQHHVALVHADLAAARRWLTRYFDTKSPAVQATLTTIQKLEAHTATLKWPDISHSVHLLRALAHIPS